MRHVQALKGIAFVINLDPDSAGARGAEKSIGVLLEEGMQVRIMELDGGLDPDEYCKERGADAYRERIEQAKGYFYWLADAARKKFDMRTSEGKISVLQYLLPAVQKISDRLERMTVANDVAGYLGVEKNIVLDTFLRSAAGRVDNLVELPKSAVRADERGLVNVILSGAEGAEPVDRRAFRNGSGFAGYAPDLAGRHCRSCGRRPGHFRRRERPAGGERPPRAGGDRLRGGSGGRRVRSRMGTEVSGAACGNGGAPARRAIEDAHQRG